MDELEKIRKKKMEDLLRRARPKEYPYEQVEVSDDNFHEFVRRHPLVVIDFWAAWCGP